MHEAGTHAVMGRLWSALVAAWGVFIGLLPHVLHHVGPLAGAALLAGTGGTRRFGRSRAKASGREPGSPRLSGRLGSPTMSG